MSIILIILFLLSSGFIIYHHLIFPVLLSLININRHSLPHYIHRDYSPTPHDHLFPSVHIIIPAHNEAKYIQKKIQNLTTIDYPEDKLKITIVCDGSKDDTHQIATDELTLPECSHLNAEVIRIEENAGKVAVINQFVPESDADIVVLSDVSAIVSSNCLLVIAAYFEQRKDVGAICGSYQFVPAETTGEQVYWNYQRKIKIQESVMGSTIGMHGAFYAIRQDLFQQIPPDTINDDVTIPLNIIKQGYRCLYDPRLITVELEPSCNDMDFNRRIRIAAGNLQQSIRHRELIHPRYGKIAFNFFSGKFLRPFIPVFLIAIFISSALLAFEYLLFQLVLLLQLVIYIKTITFMVIKKQPESKLIRIIYYIVSGHIAMTIGMFNYLTKRTTKRWHKIPKSLQE